MRHRSSALGIRSLRLLSFLLVLVLVAAACAPGPAAPAAQPTTAPAAAQPTSAPAAASGKPIKIAAVAPLTGALAKQGNEVVNSVEIAVEEWNAKGGVLGRPIELVKGDDQGDPAQGTTVAQKIADDPDVLGVVYGITSVTCIPASDVFVKSNLAMISPGCTNPRVTDRNLPNVNRVCARDDLQGPAGAIYMKEELKATTVAAIDDGTTGPKGAADEFQKKAEQLGMKVLRYQIRAGDKDFRPLLGTIPKDIQAIYASVWAPDAAQIAKQRLEVGLRVPMLGPDGQFEVADYIQASGGSAEGNYVTFLAPDVNKIPEAEGYVKAFKSKYGEFSSYGPLAYEAANIILAAIQKTGKTDRESISKAVRETKDHKGILGRATGFDQKGDVLGGIIYVYQVKGNGFEFLKTVSVAQ